MWRRSTIPVRFVVLIDAFMLSLGVIINKGKRRHLIT
ncbi:hypothetical protein BCEP4_670029 [Burkholderia cepacia]|nr:hypothetical protein BCEP4_670029 [Burkholderia cepacia]